MVSQNKVNYQIKVPRIQLVLSDGTMQGDTLTKEALRIAEEEQMDLVQVSPGKNGKLPVCKILDYGKLMYEQKKKSRHNKHDNQVKEIRTGYTTSDHDIEFKHKSVKEFLAKNHKVKYTLRLDGREMRMAKEAMNRFKERIQEFSDIAKWSEPRQSGKNISTILVPS